MFSDGTAVRIENLSKHYLLYDRPEDRLKQMLLPRLDRAVGRPPRAYFRDFAALHDVSFTVGRGETVGIIGRNGSGKSTLLQIVCGTLRPSSGTVEVNGRIAALLELGAGFNPEFTGRENVFLNAAILGLSRAEVNERFDAIARFADIGHFIDQPVKTYSSGMYMRLAFATAINVDPDILVIDEALAVGDEAFQRKCFARIEEIQERGGTILFVSHGAQTIVQLCSRALLFDAGELLLEGRPKLVTGQYQRLVNLTGDEARAVREEIRALGRKAVLKRADAEPAEGAAFGSNAAAPHEPANAPVPPASLAPVHSEAFDPALVSQSRVDYESHGAQIDDVRIETGSGRRVNVLQLGKRYAVGYDVAFLKPAKRVICGMQIKTVNGLVLAGANNERLATGRIRELGFGETLKVRFEFVCRMTPGTYLLDTGVIGVQDGQERFLHRILDALIFRVAVQEDLIETGYFSLSPTFSAFVIGRDTASVRVA